MRSVFIGIKVAPEANILDVAKRVREAFPDLQNQLPTGVTGQIVYDSTEFINTSIKEVVKTLVEALVIVAVVIYLFLGTFRAVLVPLVAMPLSLVGAFFIMLMLGYSINLLTLLAHGAGDRAGGGRRHHRGGERRPPHEGEGIKTPLQAALIAARELGSPIIAMTVVLIAVYVPIGFQGGLTGALFTEFAFTLAGVGARVGHRRADAVADDVRQDLLARPGQRQVRQGHRPRLREGAQRTYTRWLRSLLQTPGPC